MDDDRWVMDANRIMDEACGNPWVINMPGLKSQKYSVLNSAVSERINSESALFRAEFLSSKTLGFQRWTKVIYSKSALILTHVDENNKLW